MNGSLAVGKEPFALAEYSENGPPRTLMKTIRNSFNGDKKTCQTFFKKNGRGAGKEPVPH